MYSEIEVVIKDINERFEEFIDIYQRYCLLKGSGNTETNMELQNCIEQMKAIYFDLDELMNLRNILERKIAMIEEIHLNICRIERAAKQ